MESLYCFLVFGWIKLKFGVRGHVRLLILNLNSNTQYKSEILKNATFLFSDHDFKLRISRELVTMATVNDLSLIFISNTSADDCLKVTLVWWKSFEPFLRYSAKTLEDLLVFICRILMTS